MNLNKFHGVYFRGTPPHPTRKVLPLSLSGDSPSTLPISEPFLPCSALPRPLWYLPAAVITHLQTFGPRLLYAWTKMVVGSEWGSIFCYLHWTTKWAAAAAEGKRKKFQIFLNEFNIHKVWKILLGKLRKAPKKQTTGSQAAIIIVLNIILQTLSSSSSSPSSSTSSSSSSSSSATWFRSRHTPVHVSFMSSYMISGLCLLICSHNNFYATPCVPAPCPSRAACKGFSCCNQLCANLGQVPGTSTPTKRGKWERVEGRGRTVGRGR